MDVNRVFQVSTDKIVSETFDDEIVLVNLESGNYYNLTHSAIDIWSDIQQKLPVGKIIDRLAVKYEAAKADIEIALDHFLAKMQKEGLISLSSESAVVVADASDVNTGAMEKQPFAAPALQSFTDMQELLLLDPVHDVQDSGWPYQNKDS